MSPAHRSVLFYYKAMENTFLHSQEEWGWGEVNENSPHACVHAGCLIRFL